MLKDKEFSGFVVAVSAAMLRAVYGTFTSEATRVMVRITLGLLATAIGMDRLHQDPEEKRLDQRAWQ